MGWDDFLMKRCFKFLHGSVMAVSEAVVSAPQAEQAGRGRPRRTGVSRAAQRHIQPIRRAGTPAIRAKSGTSEATTAPAAIKA